jgi:hypothetical protein
MAAGDEGAFVRACSLFVHRLGGVRFCEMVSTTPNAEPNPGFGQLVVKNTIEKTARVESCQSMTSKRSTGQSLYSTRYSVLFNELSHDDISQNDRPYPALVVGSRMLASRNRGRATIVNQPCASGT